MGCGPSTIINPRKWRGRAQSNQSGSDAGSDEDGEDGGVRRRAGAGAAEDGEAGALLLAGAGAGGGGPGAGAGAGGPGAAGLDADDDATARAAAARLRLLAQAAPGPVLSHTYVPQIEVSESQQDFFRILDAKVESGPELDPEDDNEKLREEARLRGLLRDWERYSQRQVQPPPQPRAARHALDGQPPLSRGMSAVAAVAEQDGHGLGPAARGAPGRHPALHPALHASSTVSSSSMPSSGMHDASWRRANLSWVPEQRPVGMSPAKQAYPGRAVAWSHTAYQSFDGQGQQGLVQGLGSSWYSAATNAPPSATASSQQVGFRPYRQMSEAGSQVGQWVEAGAGYDDPMLYHGHGLGGDPYYQQHYPVHGQGLERGHGRYGHLGQGHVQATAGLGHSPRLPDQHLANSMVQLDKSGNTRTELA